MFRRKKALALILSVFMLVSIFEAVACASFTDVTAEDKALSEAVNTLLSKGITKGINESQFGTDLSVTREQMAAFIYRMVNKGQSVEGGENTTLFTDLDDPTFYAMISWANENGIIKGRSTTEFDPKGSITLQDCYTMVVRALEYEKENSLSYPDGYINIAKEIGLSQNIDASIANTSFITRGDVAIVLHNAILAADAHILDGKKIIFIGNSFTYYGKTVIDVGNVVDKEVMAARFEDKGYFYQMCKQNGANVTVTNWTWGGHTLNDTFGGNCSANRGHDGHDHLADLRNFSDMQYDYVIIQPGSSDTVESIKSGITEIQNIFKAANPNVKFIYNVHPRYYLRGNENDKSLIAKIDEVAEELNLDVANWGVVVNDIINGTAVVENSALDYNENTFIVTKSATDGYHPNMLSGYITTQMVYSVLTGEKAFGEDYSFCTDTTVNEKFSVEAFLKSYYKYDNVSPEDSETKLTGDELTTFPEVFKSPSDMEGVQKLIDKYLEAK